jgi:RNA polymerase sigma-70 factor (ECF subfamily)
MRSEAVYFPRAVASTPALNANGHCTPEGASRALDVPGSHSGPATAITVNAKDSDELLLKQVSEGDREALGLLFQRYARSVRNVAYRILRSEAEADDLVQEVFLFIFRKATQFDSSYLPANSWIIHLTYHRAFDRRRYLKSRHFYTDQELVETSLRLADPRQEIPFHEQSMEGILGKQLVARFNLRLSPEQRETIQLYFFEGYALKEIAQLTGRPLANVRGHYYRGLEQMRKFVLPNKMRSK